jgi:hypothetical protein
VGALSLLDAIATEFHNFSIGRPERVITSVTWEVLQPKAFAHIRRTALMAAARSRGEGGSVLARMIDLLGAHVSPATPASLPVPL